MDVKVEQSHKAELEETQISMTVNGENGPAKVLQWQRALRAALNGYNAPG